MNCSMRKLALLKEGIEKTALKKGGYMSSSDLYLKNKIDRLLEKLINLRLE